MFQFWPSFFVDFAKIDVVNFALLGRQVKNILDNFLEKKLCPAPHVCWQLCQGFVHGHASGITLVQIACVMRGECLRVTAVAQTTTAPRVHAITGEDCHMTEHVLGV